MKIDVAEEDDWEETAYEYSAPARLIADRLDIMGFTLDGLVIKRVQTQAQDIGRICITHRQVRCLDGVIDS